MENFPNASNNSRRNFIKNMGVLSTGVVAAGLSSILNSSCTEENTSESKESDVNSILKTLESKNIENIIKNPYLVYALYYSESAIENIKRKQLVERTPQENKLLEISEIITPELREMYIQLLDETLEENSVSNKINLPLDKIDIGDVSKNHKDALDLFMAEGSSVYNMKSGIVVMAEDGWTKTNLLSTSSQKGGNTVIVYNNKEKKFYRYAHLERVHIKPGEIVESGTILGTVGHTGINASKPGHGNHLHLEINKYDPETKTIGAVSAFKLKKIIENI